MTATAPTAPQSPAAFASYGNLVVTWKPPSSNGGAPVDLYVVQQATSAVGPWTTIASNGGFSAYGKGVQIGTRYYFRVAAHNSAGWGPVSTVVSAVHVVPPGAPHSPVVKPHITPGFVWVGWQAPASNGGDAVDMYRVQVATHPAGSWDWLADASTPGLKTPVPKPGTTLYYRIAAHNVAGWGPYSTAAAYSSPAVRPSKPADCWAYQLGGEGSTEMRIGWTLPASNGGAPILFYRVSIYGANGLVTQTYAWSGTTVDVDLTHWQNSHGSAYSVYISAFNKVGDGLPCLAYGWMAR